MTDLVVCVLYLCRPCWLIGSWAIVFSMLLLPGIRSASFSVFSIVCLCFQFLDCNMAPQRMAKWHWVSSLMSVQCHGHVLFHAMLFLSSLEMRLAPLCLSLGHSGILITFRNSLRILGSKEWKRSCALCTEKTLSHWHDFFSHLLLVQP